MEALLLIFGELIFAILAPFVAIVLEAIGAIISAIVSIFSTRSTEPRVPGKIATWIAGVLAALAGIVFMAVLVVNFFFFEASAHYVLQKAEDRTGIATRCEDIDGSLLAGRVELVDCRIARAAHPTSTFELSLGSARIDVKITSLLGTATLETASVTGLKGWVDVARRADGARKEKSERPRREFVIEQLSIGDTELKLSGVKPDGNAFDVPVAIDRLEIAPLRSRFMLFDVLFRSNAAGTLAGAPFALKTSEIDDGRVTQWRATQVPIASFGAMTGGLLSWFSSGNVDLQVDDEWQRGDTTEIDMDWQLRFTGIEVSPPPGTGRVTRFVTGPLTSYVNSFDGEFPMDFELTLNEDQFEYQSSLAAAGLWSAIGGAANNALKLVGVEFDSAESTGETLKDGAKSILDRVRRRSTDDEEDIE